jgi:hypothetical protein
MTEDFYKSLKGFNEFAALSDAAHYVAAPADWYAVVTDIKGSTRAIEEGRYKDVNLAGAAVITSVLNAVDEKELPYAFGGDGATLLIPARFLPKTLEALSAVQRKIARAFGLDLRAGCAPLQKLHDAGGWLRVSKFRLSPQMAQAVFQGTALGLAEKWLKEESKDIVLPPEEKTGAADLSGLKCRWKPIESRNGKVISLLVRATDKHRAEPWRVYAEVLKDIAQIYPDYDASSPAPLSGLGVSFSRKELSHEARLRGGEGFGQQIWIAVLAFINIFNKIFFLGKNSPFSSIGRKYLSEMSAHSDARKFDEMLRMVLDSREDQIAQLRAALDKRQRAGDTVYGLHASSKALMTCLVFSAQGNHVHFIDGADGGYALAAKEMKKKIRS